MAEPSLAPNVFDRLLKDRIIWLGSEVRDDNANEISAKLLLLAAEDPEKDIYLYINSPGGSITAGMAIYDTMQFVPNDIVTVGIGMAASMGQLLLTAGTKGKRYITPNARVLLHQPHGGFGGTSSDIQTQAQLILSMKKRLAEITAAATGKTPEQVNADGDRDRWFTADEALEYGFVDHIRESATDVTGGGVRGAHPLVEDRLLERPGRRLRARALRGRHEGRRPGADRGRRSGRRRRWRLGRRSARPRLRR